MQSRRCESTVATARAKKRSWLSENGKLIIEVPPDRIGDFEPNLSARHNVGLEASNDATFATGTATLLTIGPRPITRNALEYALISGNDYRYYRYLSPSGAPGGIADLEFVGKYRPGVVGQPCPVIINPREVYMISW
jgi:hypothetical protein